MTDSKPERIGCGEFLMETPEGVSDRVLHEVEIPPGSIFRRHWERDGDIKTGPWFLVLSEPHGYSEKVQTVQISGEKTGRRRDRSLRDIGVRPSSFTRV